MPRKSKSLSKHSVPGKSESSKRGKAPARQRTSIASSPPKLTEEVLRKSEERYHSLFKNMLNGFAYCQMIFEDDQPRDFVYLDANDAFEKLTGLKNVAGKKASQVIPGIQRSNPELFEIYGRVARTGKPESFETYVEPLGIWFSISVHSTEKDFFVAVFDNITERKRADLLLQALNQAALSMQLAVSPDKLFIAMSGELDKVGLACAILTLDESQTCLFPQYISYNLRVVQAAEKLTGINRSTFRMPIASVDAYRQPIVERQPIFLESMVEVLQQVLPAPIKFLASQVTSLLKIPKTINVPMIVEDKVTGLFSVQSDDLRASDIPTIIAFANQLAAGWHRSELYKQVRKEVDERKQAEEKLRASEKRLRALIEHSLDNISLLGADGALLWESPSTIRTLGYAQDEFIGRTMFDLVHPDDLESVFTQFAEMVQKPKSSESGLFRLKHSNGTWRWMEVIATNLLDEPSVNAVVVNYRDVTERKLAEEAVHESEKRLNLALAGAQMGVWEWDLETSNIFWSPEIFEITGGKSDGVGGAGEAFSDLIHPQDSARVMAGVEKAIQDKTMLTAEFRIIRPDDSIRWVSILGRAEYDPVRKHLLLTGIIQDITDRKRVEDALHESEQRYRALFEDTPIPIWEEDFSQVKKYLDSLKRQGITDLREYFGSHPEVVVECAGLIRFLGVNNAALHMYRAESKNDLIKSMNQDPSKGGQEYILEFFMDIAEGRTGNSWDGAGETMLGEPIDISLSWSVVPGHEHDFSDVVVTTVDITERKRSEEEMRVSEERFRQLADNIEEVFWITDAERGSEIYISPAAEKIWGLPVESMMRQPGSFMDNILPEDRPRVAAVLEEQIAGRKTEMEYRIQRPDGSQRWIWDRAFPILDASGKVKSVAGIAADFTERKLAENALRESEQYLLEAQIIAGLGSYVLDISSGIWTGSMVLDQIFGIDKTYICSVEGWLALIHPDWREPMSDYFANEVLGKHNRFDKEYKIVRNKDKMERWVHGLGELEFDDQNRPVKMHGTIQDITVRKQVEQQMQTIFEAIPEGVLAVDAEGNIIVANAQIEALFWYRREELLGQSIEMLLPERVRAIHPRHRDEYLAVPITRAMGSGQEMYARRKDGSEFPVDISLSAMETEHGRTAISVIRDITARTQAKNALRESESRYRSLFEDSPISLWEEDFSAVKLRLDQLRREGVSDFFEYFDTHPEVVKECADLIKVLDVNQVTVSLFKANGKADLVKSLGKMLGNEPDKQFEYELANLAEGKTKYQTELINLTLEGDPINVDMTWTVAPGHEGDLSKVIVTIIDITERKQADMEIRRHVAELQALYENGLAVSRLLEPREIGDRIIATFEQYLSWHHAIIHLRKEDTNDLELVASSLPNLEEESRAEVERRFNADVNKVGQGMSGWVIQTGEPIRTGNIRTDMHYVDVYEGIQSGLYMPLKIGERVIGVISVESEEPDAFTPQDERLLATLANQAAVAFENARLYRTAQMEISERKRMENLLADERNQLANRVEERTADLSRANSNLARALRIKDEFLSNMSHELRTPLNAILGLSESLTEQIAGPLNEKQLKYATTIGESGHHLLSLINDILDLAKVEAGQITLDINKVDIYSVCQASLRMIKQMAQKKNQDVKLVIDAEIGLMWADERRLKQMMVNLLSNAVKFTPENGELGLEVHRDRVENKVMIEVWDHGIGIGDHDLPRLFQPFVQLDSGLAREATGTGLGLALVAQMARLHGGSVTMKSEPGKGSRFTISLPWEPALSRDPEAKKRITGDLRALNKNAEYQRTILLIEDTKEVVMLVTDYLEMAGYRVVTAQDGVDGLTQAKVTHPDLILMDIMMPRMDGFEATQKLRSDPDFKSTPIIALTALAMPMDRERCLEAGMDEYLSKPVHLRTLVKMINGFLFSDEEFNP